MATLGINVEEQQVREGEYTPAEIPLEAAWTFWYDKKTSDKKESDQYMEGLKQLGSFNTIEGWYRHYTWLMRPSEFPKDHNILMFRKGYKPMWEEFPEGGCWIIRIKRKVSQSYVNRMWENLLIACIGEAFDMPDVVGCVLSTRMKDDVLSVWNLSNRNSEARFRIGEKLKEVLDLDMNAMIQYKEHMQSLSDYSTYRNAKNYMFAPSPNVTPMIGTLETPLQTHQDEPTDDFDGMLPPAAIDTMLPAAAVDTEGFGFSEQRSPPLSASKSPALSAAAPPWTPPSATLPSPSVAEAGKSPSLSPNATPWYPPSSGPTPAETLKESPGVASVAPEAAAEEKKGSGKSWAAIAAAGAGGKTSPKADPTARPKS